jgi:phosphoenolpyruvate carboxylase
MQNAESIMQELFDMPAYRKHVENRNNNQTIMLGFSDGTKDGGYLQANWSIFKTKERMTDVCRKYGIRTIFFDGRGGPPERGGGKTHRFYASQSPQTANHAIQLTIQGQTITSLYGTPAHFVHNCEQLLTAGLSIRLSGKENTISVESRQMIEALAKKSHDAYSKLKNHPLFVSYLENKSPLKYYGRINIGSRPAKRGDSKKLEFEDLRAISFVGSWSQLRQNVPGYFGIGTALKSMIDEGYTDELKRLYKEVPFFKTLILNSMMSMAKCNFQLTTYMAQDSQYKDFWHLLHDEYMLARKTTLLISDTSILMEQEPVSRQSIKLREEIVLPLLVIQQYALQKIDDKSEHFHTYEKIIQRAMIGNINSSRNAA